MPKNSALNAQIWLFGPRPHKISQIQKFSILLDFPYWWASKEPSTTIYKKF